MNTTLATQEMIAVRGMSVLSHVAGQIQLQAYNAGFTSALTLKFDRLGSV
jgi:hypothetical protein